MGWTYMHANELTHSPSFSLSIFDNGVESMVIRLECI